MPYRRLLRLMQAAKARCHLDLSGTTVLTEAASGAYASTSVLAALAGAEVWAFAKATRWGTAAAVASEVNDLAHLARVSERVRCVEELTPRIVEQADVITNSGHLRPIDRRIVSWMRRGAVIPLMYEAWEFRAADVDLEACREKGILYAGTNERIPSVGVFQYLGMTAVKLLHEGRIPVSGSQILLLCDNPFRSYLEDTLLACGAVVTVAASAKAAVFTRDLDCVFVAVRPGPRPAFGASDCARLAAEAPGATVAQYWGDVDRRSAQQYGLAVWPAVEAPPGHMGVLLSAIGPDPIVRLQAGGLKVGEVLLKSEGARTPDELEYVDPLPSPR
jgi:hypothetical protein